MVVAKAHNGGLTSPARGRKRRRSLSVPSVLSGNELKQTKGITEAFSGGGSRYSRLFGQGQ